LSFNSVPFGGPFCFGQPNFAVGESHAASMTVQNYVSLNEMIYDWRCWSTTMVMLSTTRNVFPMSRRHGHQKNKKLSKKSKALISDKAAGKGWRPLPIARGDYTHNYSEDILRAFESDQGPTMMSDLPPKSGHARCNSACPLWAKKRTLRLQ